MFDKMPNLKKFKGKKVVIPWSGGLDSTGLLLAMADAGAEVTALSIPVSYTHLTLPTNREV